MWLNVDIQNAYEGEPLIEENESELAVKVPSKKFEERWKEATSDSKFQNQSRWVAITASFGFVNLLTVFSGVYAYFFKESVAARFMQLFISYGREQGEEYAIICFISSLQSFLGFVIGCASVSLRHQTNMKHFVRCFTVQETVHSFALLISALFYARVWMQSDSFLKRGDYLYDPLRVFSEQEDIFNAINDFQKKFQCCGIKSYQDWINIKWWSGDLSPAETSDMVFKTPLSCCSSHTDMNHSCVWSAEKTSDLTINKHGCKGEAKDILRKELFTKMILLAVIASCHLIILMFLIFAVQSLPPMEVLELASSESKVRNTNDQQMWISDALEQMFEEEIDTVGDELNRLRSDDDVVEAAGESSIIENERSERIEQDYFVEEQSEESLSDIGSKNSV